MTKRWNVKVTLVSQLRSCPNGHKVGDQWMIGRKTPEGICLGAFASILPYITTLRFGGVFPWEKVEGEGYFCCPDPAVVNVFRLERTAAGEQEEPDTAGWAASNTQIDQERTQ